MRVRGLRPGRRPPGVALAADRAADDRGCGGFAKVEHHIDGIAAGAEHGIHADSAVGQDDPPAILTRKYEGTGLGLPLVNLGDLEGAEGLYRQALKLTPNRPTLYNNLGNVLCDLGRMRDGIAAYETAIALEKSADPAHEPSPEALVNLELAKVENRLNETSDP